MLTAATHGYRGMAEYFSGIRALFEVVGVRFAIAEYGTRLAPVAGNELFSNANSYLLSDDSSYPYYLWLPTWLGRFYVDPGRVPPGVAIDDCRIADARLLAFVWPWLGFNDAFVADAPAPECWFGVADPAPDDGDQPVRQTAESIFNYFRIERTCEGESDGWFTGNFERNEIGCSLGGSWHLRRVPLAELTSYYEVEQSLIRPLGEKFSALASADPALRE